jgi:O-antigen ligase
MSPWGDPVLWFWAAATTLCAILLVAQLALSSPRWAISWSYVVVLLAGTKLRLRDPSASLSGDLDFQIVLELALYGVLAVVVAVLFLACWRTLRPLAAPELLLFGYVILALSSLSWSVVPTFTGIRTLQLLILFGLAVLSVRVLGAERTTRVASIAVVLYVLVCSAAVVAGLPGAGAYTRTDFFGVTRFSWFAVHPITVGTYAGVAMLSVLATGLWSPRGWRDRFFGIPSWLSFAPLFVILALTYSRGPLLASLGATGVLLLKRARFGNAILLSAGGTLVAVVMLAQWAESDNPIVHALLRGQSVEQVISLTGRTELWERAMPLFLDSPVFGQGYHGSRPVLLTLARWAGYAHNALLQTVLDLGIIGVLLLWPTLLWLAAKSLLQPFDSNPRTGVHQAFVLATMVFVLLNGVTSESFAGPPGYEVLLVFVCTSLASQRRSEAPAEVALQLSRAIPARTAFHPPNPGHSRAARWH